MTAFSQGVQSVKVDTATSGSNTIVAALTGHSIVVISYVLTNTTGTTTLVWGSGSTALTGPMVTANAGVISADAGGKAVLITDASAALTLTLGANTQVSGHVSFYYD